MQFQDKVVLVTVAGSGSGGTQAFARAGARVMLADINAEQGQQCLKAIKVTEGRRHSSRSTSLRRRRCAIC